MTFLLLLPLDSEIFNWADRELEKVFFVCLFVLLLFLIKAYILLIGILELDPS